MDIGKFANKTQVSLVFNLIENQINFSHSVLKNNAHILYQRNKGWFINYILELELTTKQIN